MRGRALLIYRLVASSLRRRPVEVVVTVVAIAAATTTLMVGLALRDVSAHPYQTTRALTAGPDIAAMPSNPSPASLAQLVALQHAPGVVAQRRSISRQLPDHDDEGFKGPGDRRRT